MNPSPRPSRSKGASIAGAALVTVALMAVGAFQARPDPPPVGTVDVAGEENPQAGRAAFTGMRTVRGELDGTHPYVAAREQVLRMLGEGGPAPGAAEREWRSLGPSNVGGRVLDLVVDPNDTDVLYAGGATGGVWKSSDAGGSWTPLTETFSNVGVSALALDPSDSNTLYVGTGEQFASRVAEVPFNGVGIMKTTDAGATWRLLPATVDDPDFRVVNDIVVSGSDPDVLYAGVSAGVARSADGGETWEVVHEVDSYSGCGRLALRTDRTPDVLLASCSDVAPEGVYLSEDGGESWEKVIDEVDGEPAGTTAVAFAPSDQDIVYASVGRTYDSPRGPAGTLGLLRSDDGGRTWQVRNDGAANWLGYCSDESGQAFYSHAIAVDPTDPDRLWLGGIDAFRSDDGGRTVTIAGYWWWDRWEPPPSPGLHADQHVIVFDPGYDGVDNQTVYFGNDGGVYRTANSLAPLSDPTCDIQGVQPDNDVLYEPLNEGLSITQFWAGTVSDDGTVLMGGTQDNGTLLRPPEEDPEGWLSVIGGDGFDVAVTPEMDAYYGELYGFLGIDIYRWRPDQDDHFEPITAFPDKPPAINDRGLFYAPFAMDPTDPQRLWTGGLFMWRSTDGGDVWKQASKRLADTDSGISAIGVAPSDGNVVYLGTDSGDVWGSRDAAGAMPGWSPLPEQEGYITSITVHPEDPDTAYLTVGDFGVPHVLETTDGGETWTDIGTELPDVPASTVALNPLDPDMVFVGTDAGLFESPDGGRTWFPANGNLTSTIVQDLAFRPGTSELYLFTHGRGAYWVDVGTGE